MYSVISIDDLDNIEVINHGGNQAAMYIHKNNLVLVITSDICAFESEGYKYVCNVEVDLELLPESSE